MLDPLKLGSSTLKTQNGQNCHVGYIRLSDWSIQKILRSDWLDPNRCHILLILLYYVLRLTLINSYIESSFSTQPGKAQPSCKNIFLF